MAIGKVGSFATVEPALVDFGSMVERNIDKIKADEAAKAAAKAVEKKAIAERGKDLKLPNPLEITTLSGADMKYGDMAQGLFNDMTYAKMLYEQTGSAEAKQSFETLNYAYGQLASNVSSLKEAVPKLVDPTFLKGKNLDIAKERAEYLQKLNEDGKMRVDGRNILVKRPDGSEFRLESFVPSMMNIPDEYNYQNYIQSVKKNTDTSVTSSGSYSMNFTRENILDPASGSQRDYILNAVKTESLNDSALVDYAKKNGLKDEYGLTKTSGFTEEEREAWANQTYQDIINSFPSKEDKKFGAPKSDSGGGKDDSLMSISSEVGSRYAVTRKDGKELSKVGAGYAVALGGKPEEYKDRKREVIEMGFDENKKSFYVKYKDFFAASDPRNKKDGAIGYFYSDGQKTDVDKIVANIINPNTGLPFEGAKDADNYIKSLPSYQSYLKSKGSKKEVQENEFGI